MNVRDVFFFFQGGLALLEKGNGGMQVKSVMECQEYFAQLRVLVCECMCCHSFLSPTTH